MCSSRSLLKGGALADFAKKVDACRISVIVEAKRPIIPTALLHKQRLAGSPTETLPTSPSKRDGTFLTTAIEMRALLQTLRQLGLANRARRNDLVGAFVLEVTPQQLRALAKSPSVQAIRCNQSRRRLAH